MIRQAYKPSLLGSTAFVFAIMRLFTTHATALDIQFPVETGVFKQDVGAEIANGQCLICHSVEYISMQPPMSRAFWPIGVTVKP